MGHGVKSACAIYKNTYKAWPPDEWIGEVTRETQLAGAGRMVVNG